MFHYINTSTANDFVKSEVNEYGWDYVEAQFAEGYEPTVVNGVWCWKIPTRLNLCATSIPAIKSRNPIVNFA